MSERERPPAPRPPSRAGGLVVLVAVAAALAGVVTVSAVASLAAETYPLVPAALAVLGGAVGAAVVLPLGVGAGVLRVLRARGYAPRRGPVLGGTVALVNLAVVILVQVLGPVPLVRLLPERGTWVFDVLSGRGPFGPPAVPIVAREVAEVRTIGALAELAPRWCDDTAAATAVGLAAGLRDKGAPPLADTLAVILQRHSVDPATGTLPEGVEGRRLLLDVLDVAGAVAPVVPLAPFPEVDTTPAKIEARRIVFTTPGWEARYEQGAWRVCTGGRSDAVLAGRETARAMRDAAARLPSAAVRVGGPWDPEVRGTLRSAAFGRAAFLVGVAGLDPNWPEALTRTAAAAQAERIRTWCAAAGSADPARANALSALGVRWGVGAPGTPTDPTARALVDAQGRKYLADVLAACGPVATDRQTAEAARGLPIADGQRRRWAELEAAAVGTTAELSEDGTGGVKIEVDGRVLRAVQEDGAWRIDWRD